LKQRRDGEALSRLEALLGHRPDDAFGLRQRAQLWMRHYYVPEALGDIERLVRVTEDSEALLYAARQLLFVGNAHDAVAVCRRLPESAEALVVLGKAQLDSGELAGAVAALEGALASVRGHESVQRFASAKVTALKLLGDAHARAGEMRRALERYTEAMGCIGSNYELRRAVVKIAWDGLSASEGAAPMAATPGDEDYATRWIEPNMTAEFEGGVPVEVSSADLQLAPYLERLPWVHSVERLILPAGRRDNREAFTTLFQLGLPRLRRLDIHAEHFGFPCLFRLVGAPFFSRLEGLILRECDIDAPSLQLLVERAPRDLRELCVIVANARPPLPRATTLAELLRRWDMPCLEALELADCSLDTGEVMALTEAQLPKLTLLGLTGNDLRDLDIGRFLGSNLVKQVHTLYISNTGAEPELLLGLLDRLDGLALRSVRAHRPWTQDELRAVVSHPAYRRLDQVDFGMSMIPDDAWLALLD
jgi:tetratricopeptide (TPR) repeat protein